MEEKEPNYFKEILNSLVQKVYAQNPEGEKNVGSGIKKFGVILGGVARPSLLH